MPTVSTMHEEHHQRTRQKQRKRQDAKEVCRVFREQKKERDGDKAKQHHHGDT